MSTDATYSIFPPIFMLPHITSYTTKMVVGDQSSIFGEKFGDEQGNIYITLRNTGLRIDVEIFGWSETEVYYHIPHNTGSVPFNSSCTLTLVRNSDAMITNVPLTLEPICNDYYAKTSYSQHGHSLNPSHDHNNEQILSSPALPQEYKLFFFIPVDGDHLIQKDGIKLTWRDNTYMVGESGSKVELLSGPYKSGYHLKIQIKIKDDFYWDYTVEAVLYISVPQGFTIPSGWQG